MLTGKLVRVRHAKNKLVPQYVDPGNAALLALAEQIARGLSQRRPAGRAARSTTTSPTSSPKGRAASCRRGWRSCSRTAASSRSPPTTRPTNSAKRSSSWRRNSGPRPRGAAHPFDRTAVLREAAADSVARARAGADRPQSVRRPEGRTARPVRSTTSPPSTCSNRYNVALAQAILLRCTAMEVRVWGETPARFRQLFRSVKFHRLICTIHESGGQLVHAAARRPAVALLLDAEVRPATRATSCRRLLHCKAFDLKAERPLGRRAEGEALRALRPRTACVRTSPTSASTRRRSCRCSRTGLPRR